MKPKLNILLVDDHNLFREGLSFLLSNSPLVSQIHEAGNGVEMLAKLEETNPDIVLMDIEMPLMNGIEATVKLLDRFPETKVIALSMYADESYYSEMIDAGAKGFLLKNSKFEDVERAILEVYEGRNFFSPEILGAIIRNLSKGARRRRSSELTDREVEILYNICKGLSNTQIADTLYISKRTVDKHRENILLKTGSKNTAELVVYAVRNKIFEVQ